MSSLLRSNSQESLASDEDPDYVPSEGSDEEYEAVAIGQSANDYESSDDDAEIEPAETQFSDQQVLAFLLEKSGMELSEAQRYAGQTEEADVLRYLYSRNNTSRLDVESEMMAESDN